MGIIPFVIENSPRGERSSDIFSRLLADRIIFLDDHIMPINASVIIAQMLFLESQDSSKDIYFYINSPGGSVIAGNSILDAMDYVKCDISTIGLGQCASMAAVLLSNGTKGKRLCFERTEIMIHQVKGGGLWGQSSDIVIHAARIQEMNHDLISTLAKNCNKSLEELQGATDRDNFMSAKTAKEFGIIDSIIETKSTKNLI